MKLYLGFVSGILLTDDTLSEESAIYIESFDNEDDFQDYMMEQFLESHPDTRYIHVVVHSAVFLDWDRGVVDKAWINTVVTVARERT